MKKDDLDVEVTAEDQKMINNFSKLNQRYHEYEAERNELEEERQNIQDATNDLLLSDYDGPIKFLLGEVYVEQPKEDIQAMLEDEERKLSDTKLEVKIADAKKNMQILKEKLYDKFTKAAINLDEE